VIAGVILCLQIIQSGFAEIHISFDDGHSSLMSPPSTSHHDAPGTYTAIVYGSGGLCGSDHDTAYVSVLANHGLSMPSFSYTFIGYFIDPPHLKSFI
jgi:hypothetical protein